MLDPLGKRWVLSKRVEHSPFPRLGTSGPTELSDQVWSGWGILGVFQALSCTRTLGNQLARLGEGKEEQPCDQSCDQLASIQENSDLYKFHASLTSKSQALVALTK